MTEPVLQRELEAIRDVMTDGFAGVHSRLDTLNGRVRETEEMVSVLEDRSQRNETGIGSLGDRLALLQTKGCAVGQVLHGMSSERGDAPWWTPKRAAQVGGIAGGGVAVTLGLIELGKAVVTALAR